MVSRSCEAGNCSRLTNDSSVCLAGIPVEDLMNSETGCYVGCMNNDYEMLSLHDIYDVGHSAASATSEAMLANRVSWFYGLKGPSLTR
jgi:acyl transferase domain-containing protein